MSAAPATGASGWIVGPRYDLVFFSTLWLLPLLVLAPVGSEGLGLGAGFFFIWVYHLFIRLPHFGAMFLVTYLRRQQLPHFRKHWVRFFVAPAAILTVYALPLATPAGFDSGWGVALAQIAFIWGYQHIGMQNYGILQLYRMRAGVRSDVAGSRYERTIFYTIIVAVALLNHLVPYLANAQGVVVGDSARAINTVFFGALALLVAFYLWHLRRAGSFTWPALLYFGVSVVAMIRWPFYADLPPGSWFLVFNGHHSVAYLGLVFLMEWNSREGSSSLTVGAGLREYLKFWVPLVGFSLVLLLGVVVYSSYKAEFGYSEYSGGSLEILLGFFVAHYFVEAQIWRFRKPHNREITLPLLRPPS